MDKRKRRLLCMLEGGKKYRWIRGVPPLSFRALTAGALENYRIYGNTVGGESVGDLVESGEHAGEYKVPVTVEGKNLFSSDIEQGNILNDGTLVDSESRLRTKNYLPCEKGDYVLSFSGENIKFGCRYYDANYNLITTTTWIANNSVFSIDRINTKYIKLNFAKNNTTENISPSDITDIQLEKGSTATEYEPYHAPVTTPIYLPERIKKVGDEAEYIDYAEQKLHRIGADDIDVTLPALPVLPGTNVLSVGTAVQPSRVEVKGRIKAVGQETEPEPETAEAEQE